MRTKDWEELMKKERKKNKTIEKIDDKPLHKQYNIGSSNYAKHSIQPWDISGSIKLHYAIINFIKSMEEQYDTGIITRAIELQRENWDIHLEKSINE